MGEILSSNCVLGSPNLIISHKIHKSIFLGSDSFIAKVLKVEGNPSNRRDGKYVFSKWTIYLGFLKNLTAGTNIYSEGLKKGCSIVATVGI